MLQSLFLFDELWDWFGDVLEEFAIFLTFGDVGDENSLVSVGYTFLDLVLIFGVFWIHVWIQTLKDVTKLWNAWTTNKYVKCHSMYHPCVD